MEKLTLVTIKRNMPPSQLSSHSLNWQLLQVTVDQTVFVSQTQAGHDKIRLYRLLKQNEIHLNKIPFSVETQRIKHLTEKKISNIDQISSQPLVLHPDQYLDPGRLWPITLDVQQGNLSLQDLPSLSHSVTQSLTDLMDKIGQILESNLFCTHCC